MNRAAGDRNARASFIDLAFGPWHITDRFVKAIDIGFQWLTV